MLISRSNVASVTLGLVRGGSSIASGSSRDLNRIDWIDVICFYSASLDGISAS
jgi:hypothetical protein